jgi:hypothetical protein
LWTPFLTRAYRQLSQTIAAARWENRLDGPPIVLGAWAGIANFPRKQVIRSRRHRTAPREFDQELYKARHLIENFFYKLKQFRAIATRYDKTARNFLAAI